MKNLFIFPCNGNGLEAIECVDRGEFNIMGFIDDDTEKQDKTVFGYPIYSREILINVPDSYMLAIPGSPTSFLQRKNVISSLSINHSRYATIIHKSASISPFAKIGKNVLVMAGVVITSNAIIGDHVCVLPNTVIHHDSSIGSYSLIGANCCIASNTSICNNCYVGSGSNIINNVTVEEFSLIGLGSNVIKSISSHSIVAGNPAKNIGSTR